MDGAQQRFHWNRIGNSDKEILITNDRYVQLDDSGPKTIVTGWIRSFTPSGSLVFRPAAEGAEFYRSDQPNAPVLTPEKINNLARIRGQTFSQKKRWFDQQIKSLRLDWDKRVEMEIPRENFFEASFVQMVYRDASEWRAPLNLKFTNEPALDAGGLTREWFSILITELFDVNRGIFRFSETDRLTYRINTSSDAPMLHYRFVGLLLGKALLEGRVVGAHFATPLLKLICGYPVTWHDMQFADLEFYNSMMQMLRMDKEVVESLCFTFTVAAEEPQELVFDDDGVDEDVVGALGLDDDGFDFMMRRVEIHGTEAKGGQFNGRQGIATVFDDMGKRWTVELDDDDLGTSTVAIKQENIRLVDRSQGSPKRGSSARLCKRQNSISDGMHELRPGGREEVVTGETVMDFVNLATKYKLLDAQALRLSVLLKGLYDVVPEYLLTIFDFVELELLLGGTPTIDLADWRKNTVVEGSNSKVRI